MKATIFLYIALSLAAGARAAPIPPQQLDICDEPHSSDCGLVRRGDDVLSSQIGDHVAVQNEPLLTDPAGSSISALDKAQKAIKNSRQKAKRASLTGVEKTAVYKASSAQRKASRALLDPKELGDLKIHEAALKRAQRDRQKANPDTAEHMKTLRAAQYQRSKARKADQLAKSLVADPAGSSQAASDKAAQKAAYDRAYNPRRRAKTAARTDVERADDNKARSDKRKESLERAKQLAQTESSP